MSLIRLAKIQNFLSRRVSEATAIVGIHISVISVEGRIANDKSKCPLNRQFAVHIYLA